MMAMNSELNRLINNLARLGTIAEVDHAARTVRVKTGDNTTAWLAWPADVGKNYVRWKPLAVGIQVIMLCPSGDLSQGVIVGTLYTDSQAPSETSDTVDVIEFSDGTSIAYNSDSSTLTIDGPDAVVINCTNASVTASENAVIDAGGNAEISAGGNAEISAVGDVAATGASVTLNGGAAGGLVCQTHVCAFTGSAHPQGSSTCKGGA